jgi:hypothetical protein
VARQLVRIPPLREAVRLFLGALGDRALPK